MAEERIWRPVIDYEGLYEVSNYGEVRKVDGTMMNGNINSYGYRVVSLTKNGKKKDKKVHRLVAFAFVQTIDGKDYVNHKDGDKLNNYAGNLEWVTRGENNSHATTVLQVSTDARPVWQLSLHGEPQALYLNTTFAANMVKGNQMMIAACCKGTAQTAYGHKWEYADSAVVKQLLNVRRADAIRDQIKRLKADLDEMEKSI